MSSLTVKFRVKIWCKKHENRDPYCHQQAAGGVDAMFSHFEPFSTNSA